MGSALVRRAAVIRSLGQDPPTVLLTTNRVSELLSTQPYMIERLIRRRAIPDVRFRRSRQDGERLWSAAEIDELKRVLDAGEFR